MSNEDTDGITVEIINRDGQRYIRVANVADLLRGFANSLEPAVVVDAREIADGLRQIARDLENNVTGAGA
jgi:hypothetical protein